MIFSFRYQAGMIAFLMDKAGGEGGAGGGSGGEGGAGGDGKGKGSGQGGGDDVAALKAANKALEDRLAKLEAAGKPDPGDGKGLDEKARAEREAKEKKDSETKNLEAALRFSLGAKDWVKTNASLLPKDIDGILTAADKENYGGAIEKDQAIKAGIVQAFFTQQSNLDLLTGTQKTALEDWQKLTKNGKQDRAQQVFDSIFEPTFEMLKRIKKAEQLGKEGHAPGTDMEKAYADRMMKLSKKHYLGEKENA